MGVNDKDIDLGNIKVGSRSRVLLDISKFGIVNIEPACNCNRVNYNKETNLLEIIKKGRNIPMHLKSKGEYMVRNKYKITYNNGKVGILNIFYKVKES